MTHAIDAIRLAPCGRMQMARVVRDVGAAVGRSLGMEGLRREAAEAGHA